MMQYSYAKKSDKNKSNYNNFQHVNITNTHQINYIIKCYDYNNKILITDNECCILLYEYLKKKIFDYQFVDVNIVHNNLYLINKIMS